MSVGSWGSKLLKRSNLRLLQVAARQGLCDAVYTQSMSLAEVLRCHLQEPHSLFTDRVNFERTAADLERVTQQRSLRPGQRLFSAGEPSTELFIIESGTVDLQVP